MAIMRLVTPNFTTQTEISLKDLLVQLPYLFNDFNSVQDDYETSDL